MVCSEGTLHNIWIYIHRKFNFEKATTIEKRGTKTTTRKNCAALLNSVEPR